MYGGNKTFVYVVHGKGLVVYCYNPDGLITDKYKHKVEGKLMFRECV